MNSRVKLVLLGLFLGAFGGPAAGAAAPLEPQDPLPECCSALTVQVLYADARKPPLGAWVRVTLLSPARVLPLDGRTDVDGRITFTGLTPGVYAVHVYHRGMIASGLVVLEPCQFAGIRLVLAAPPE